MKRSYDVRTASVLRTFFGSGQASRKPVGIGRCADAVVEVLIRGEKVLTNQKGIRRGIEREKT